MNIKVYHFFNQTDPIDILISVTDTLTSIIFVTDTVSLEFYEISMCFAKSLFCEKYLVIEV